jgi:hypothetical protein
MKSIMVSREDPLIMQMRDKLQQLADPHTDLAIVNIPQLAVDLQTSATRVARALRDLDRRKDEIRRQFVSEKKIVHVTLLPKFFVSFRNARRYNGEEMEPSYEVHVTDARISTSSTSTIRPILPPLRNVFQREDTELARYPKILSTCPTIYAYGRALSGRVETPMPFLENVTVVHASARPLVTEALRAFNALSYVTPLLSAEQRDTLMEILRGKKTQHNQFSHDLVSET